MIYLYKTLIRNGYSDYKIKKQLKNGNLFIVKKGIYSTLADYNYLEVVSKKHDNAIITLETAAFCYGLIKEMPEKYYIATKQKDRKINDELVKQIFMSNNLYDIGHNTITYMGFSIEIYDLERLLIEIVRNKTNIDFAVYQEIVNSYKRLKKLLNIKKLYKYISLFKNPKIKRRIEAEVLN